MTDPTLETMPETSDAAEPINVDEVLVAADTELELARKVENDLIKNAHAPDGARRAADDVVEIQVMGVIYEDGSLSPMVNHQRSKTLRVFEIKHGTPEPKNIDDIHWLIWHSLGRPGANGVRPLEPAIGAVEDRVFDEWYDSVESLRSGTETRGKAGS